MDDKHNAIDKVLEAAIERIRGGDPGAGLTDDVGRAIDEVAAETPPDTGDAGDAGVMERIQGNHRGGEDGCRETSPEDLQRVRDINARNDSRREQRSIGDIVEEHSDDLAEAPLGGKPRLYEDRNWQP